MPPASAVNNNNAAVQAAAAERAEKLRGSLKGFILADRQRRQEEYERQCEELRQRREREARERENNLSLEDTRGQINRLDEQLLDLHQKKHQLLMQLKKVINDDETRKKQNEVFALHQQAMQQAAASVATTQVFLPPVRLQQQQPHHQVSMLQKPAPSGSQSTSVKRGRSPSPPSQPPPQSTHQGYYKSTASFAAQKSSTQYPSTATVFYQSAAAPNNTQHQSDAARLQSIYNYSMPLRQAYHVELQGGSGTSATITKAPSPKAPTMQVLHINLDQPPISQTDLVQVQSSVQSSKPQVTMEKLPERYHIDVKHDGPSHVPPPPPPHLLSEGVIYKPLLSELSLHPSVLQISSSAAQVQNPKSTGSITQGYAPGRGAAAYDQQLTRQQLSSAPPPSSPHGQQLQYSRRLY
ncbi:CG17002 [Drosophila busckii]|uniref:CG17002 n=1 Tax=Drosophila busckii TaxID=30019 RepID=A0A0M3QVF9_DROBS|nr:uncharacterized protein LOC108595318 [Drosophila busckii]ALC42349.1 CG17002 [Drosophila busckii]